MQAAFTPRQRQEIEPSSLLQSRQEIPLVRAQSTFSTIVTARADAYFLVDGLWVANVTAAGHDYSLCLVAPADAAAQGTLFPWREDFAFPVASSAQNTATTIVCPATTGVIWRVTAGFYVAP